MSRFYYDDGTLYYETDGVDYMGSTWIIDLDDFIQFLIDDNNLSLIDDRIAYLSEEN